MSEELKQFYRDLQAWVDAGMPESREFSPDIATCPALLRWARLKLESTMPGVQGLLLDENEDLFISLDLDAYYPFNDGIRAEWWAEKATGTFYKNPERLAFIKEMAQ
ncbi:hypothetical protein [Lonsdalea quercina]|uniref:hypothetical protein n=1 Tax=Lonsdalea quercina TaxID=71657 RepID=UPI003976F4A8